MPILREAERTSVYSILIAEDDDLIRTELQTLLEKYGYQAVLLHEFDRAAELVQSLHPNLVLLDINLPVYDGYHICREIRKTSKVPIIVVTSRDSDVDELMSMNLGADDFITKPYNTQILLARIAALLNRAYGDQTANQLVFGSLILDISKSHVICEKNTTELTKNEQRILALLIRNKNTITSRTDIMNELWQSDEFVDDNTLTVNINRLRKKLDALGASDRLKTLRGQGYLLCD